ncbi:hypothetical protein SPAB_05138 [Salmonella enterica subsp. enterica serovar Paratyphi B str. SPB7]|uniref:Uncharacterized protein n=1 Tax=Salmonella paratyphi B (strain ATCC BAA-1250 / SPB7) TaxID=1016998 RepID=A0A6C6Z9V3_SALPB|nr:hypothetical protein SPAB_05138 [Salmonella enterica subsp. enterica serovar Paratyphi B str. SPB7]
MLLATHSLAALPQPEYLGYTSAISRIRGGKIVDKITAHVKTNLSSQMRSDQPDQRQRQHPWWWRC